MHILTLTIIESLSPTVTQHGILVDSNGEDITVNRIKNILRDRKALDALEELDITDKNAAEDYARYEEEIKSDIRDFRDSIWYRWLLNTQDGTITRVTNKNLIFCFSRCPYNPDLPDTDNTDFFDADTYLEVLNAARTLCWEKLLDTPPPNLRNGKVHKEKGWGN